MGEEEAKQPEEAKQESTEEAANAEEKKKEEEAKAPSISLFVDLHCVGCAKKIERSILRIRGVEGVTVDMAKNQVTIKGVVEPQAVCSRIMKKMKRMAKLLSPLPEAEAQPIPDIVASQVSGLVTIELDVYMHCQGCADQLNNKILKMKGVRTVETDFSSSKVKVTGTMDSDRLVDYVYRRTKKQAKVVPQPQPAPKPDPEPEKPEEKPAPPAEEESKAAGEEKKEEGHAPPEEEKEKDAAAAEEAKSVEEQSVNRMVYCYQPLYVIERIPAPQLFSDENPNACVVM